jgi:S1-C subfamily serine protease
MNSAKERFLKLPIYVALYIGLITCHLGKSAAYSQSKANEVYKKASPSIVLIKTDKGTGTGFIVSSDGLIATALHVIEGASKQGNRPTKVSRS